ncbi:MAG: hypothetical protein ACO3A2_07775 [Bdellovibrionia bacterium]
MNPSVPVTIEMVLNALELRPMLHARFLNTLSLLEYIGARKIFKSQAESSINASLLAHAAEEIHHAQTFKKLALKLSQGKLTSYSEDHLLCGREAKEYFQCLDYGVHAEVETDSWMNYLYTTLLIEERANQVYPLYEPILARAGFAGILKSIVKEEASHMQDILKHLQEQTWSITPASQLSHPLSPASLPVVLPTEDSLKSDTRLMELRMLEAAAFEKFTQALHEEIHRLEPTVLTRDPAASTSTQQPPGLMTQVNPEGQKHSISNTASVSEEA